MRLGVLRRIRAALGLVFVLSLVALSFYAGQQSIHGMAVKELEEMREEMPEIRSYTKASCTEVDGLVRCVDRHVMNVDGQEFVVEEDRPLGETVLPP